MRMARSGRRPGPDSTSGDVLDAARRLFAQRGYRATTVRAIAEAAGVTPGMIHHFFGSKQQVFLAAIRMPLDPVQVLAVLTAGPRREFPERLVRTFVGFWTSEQTGPALRGMLRSAIADEEQAAALRSFADAVMLPQVSAALGVPVADAATALSTMLGLVVARMLIGIETLASLTEDEIVSRYAPVVRAALGL
jgi:AcrR family transcriptional regulator